jgi:hypothetical protein
MTAILENVYRKLADEKYGFTETDFSEQFLGKSGGYCAYLRSTKRNISADALLRLWGKLVTGHNMHAAAISRTEHTFRKQILMDSAELFKELSDEVFTELCERAGAVKTQPVHQ